MLRFFRPAARLRSGDGFSRLSVLAALRCVVSVWAGRPLSSGLNPYATPAQRQVPGLHYPVPV